MVVFHVTQSQRTRETALGAWEQLSEEPTEMILHDTTIIDRVQKAGETISCLSWPHPMSTDQRRQWELQGVQIMTRRETTMEENVSSLNGHY